MEATITTIILEDVKKGYEDLNLQFQHENMPWMIHFIQNSLNFIISSIEIYHQEIYKVTTDKATVGRQKHMIAFEGCVFSKCTTCKG